MDMKRGNTREKYIQVEHRSGEGQIKTTYHPT